MLKEELTLILHKLFQKNTRTLPSSSYEPDTKNKTKTAIKEVYKPISLLNTDANIIN